MFAPLVFLDTPGGRLELGAEVRTLRGPAHVRGLITSLRPVPEGIKLEVNGRHTDLVQYFELLAPPEPVGRAMLKQATTGVTSGAFEVWLPTHGDRIYFADTPAQVIALLAMTIGIPAERQAGEVQQLAEAARGGDMNERSYRGIFGPGSFGPLAYVSLSQPRPAPLFQLKERVLFFNHGPVYLVSGIILVRPLYGVAGQPYGSTEWHYLHEGARQPFAIGERDTQRSPELR